MSHESPKHISSNDLSETSSRVISSLRMYNETSDSSRDDPMKSYYSCVLCSKKFAVRNDVVKHIEDVHGESEDNVEMNITQYQCHECPVCCKIFECESDADAHMSQTHASWEVDKTKERSPKQYVKTYFKCILCSSNFIELDDASEHMKNVHDIAENTENIEKYWECSLCLKTFNDLSNSYIHVRQKHIVGPATEESEVIDLTSKNCEIAVSLQTDGGTISDDNDFEPNSSPLTGNNEEDDDVVIVEKDGACQKSRVDLERGMESPMGLELDVEEIPHLQDHVIAAPDNGGNEENRLHPMQSNSIGGQQQASDTEPGNSVIESDRNVVKGDVSPSRSQVCYQCPVCDEIFSVLSDLSKHKMEVHANTDTEDKPYKCSFCKERFRSSRIASKHVCKVDAETDSDEDVEDDSVVEIEDESEQEMETDSDVNVAVNNKNSKVPDKLLKSYYICDLCTKTFTVRIGIVKHFKDKHKRYDSNRQTNKTHPIKEFHECSLCAKVFNSEVNAVHHMRRAHALLWSDRAIEIGREQFMDSYSGHNQILDTYSGHKQFVKSYHKCGLCTSTFSASADAWKHMKDIHTSSDANKEIKRYWECSLCLRAFNNQGNSYKHVRCRHKSELERNRLSASEDSLSLKTQEVYETPITPPKQFVKASFKCVLCSSSFSTLLAANEHVESVHEGSDPLVNVSRYWECSLCSKVCNFLSNAYKHLRSSHGDTVRGQRLSVRKAYFINYDSPSVVDPKQYIITHLSCLLCKMTFSELNVLRDHVRTVHLKPDVAQFTSRYRECSLCKKTFNGLSNAYKHVRFSHRSSLSGQSTAGRGQRSTASHGQRSTASRGQRSTAARGQRLGVRKSLFDEFDKHPLVLTPKVFIKTHVTCSLCKITFSELNALRDHVRTVHMKSDVTQFISRYRECALCEKTFNSLSNSYKHVRLNHRTALRGVGSRGKSDDFDKSSDMDWESEEGDEVSDTSSEQDSSVGLNRGSDKNPGRSGKQSSGLFWNLIPSESNTNRHLNGSQTSGTKGKNSMTDNNKTADKNYRSQPRPKVCYQCHLCDQAFNSISDLSKHKIDVHQMDTVEGDNTSLQYKCSFCFKTFRSSFRRAIHLKVNTVDNPNKSKRFDFRSKVYKLKWWHKKDRPYKCCTCGKSFDFKSNLSRHILLFQHKKGHGNRQIKTSREKKGASQVSECDTSFSCPVCAKKFSVLSDLVWHRIKVCTVQEENIASRMNDRHVVYPVLASNRKNNCGKRPYRCSKCGRTASSLSSVYRHMERKHPDLTIVKHGSSTADLSEGMSSGQRKSGCIPSSEKRSEAERFVEGIAYKNLSRGEEHLRDSAADEPPQLSDSEDAKSVPKSQNDETRNRFSALRQKYFLKEQRDQTNITSETNLHQDLIQREVNELPENICVANDSPKNVSVVTHTTTNVSMHANKTPEVVVHETPSSIQDSNDQEKRYSFFDYDPTVVSSSTVVNRDNSNVIKDRKCNENRQRECTDGSSVRIASVERVTGNQPYECSVCQRRFGSLSNAYKHIRRIHKQYVIQKRSNAMYEKQQASHVEATIQRLLTAYGKEEMGQKGLLYNKEETFLGTSTMSDRAEVNNAKKVHSNVIDCSKSLFVIKSWKHNTLQQMPYKCSGCGQMFNFLGNCYKHMRRVHKGCTIEKTIKDCEQTPTSAHLPQEKAHHPNDKCLCPECGLTFDSSIDLYKHIESQHEGNVREKEKIGIFDNLLYHEAVDTECDYLEPGQTLECDANTKQVNKVLVKDRAVSVLKIQI